MGRQKEFQIGSQGSKAIHGFCVSGKVSFRGEQIDRATIERVSGEKQPAFAIEKAQGVGGVARRE